MKNETNAYHVGIDIGGTNTVIGVVRQDGEIVEQKIISTKSHSEFEIYIESLVEVLRKLHLSYKNIKGIGIGAPNGNAYNGTIEHAPNLPWKGILPIKEILQNKLKVPVFVANDANAAAMGEKIYGGAKKMRDFIVITLGTGVGSGIYANGQLIYGHDAFAGEIGHVITIPNGRKCACGRNGCIEAYASAQGVVKTFIELQKENNKDFDAANTAISTKEIYDLACKGDKIAMQTFEDTARVLALTLANSIAHTSPEAIFIFGGLANAGDFLLTPLKKFVDEFVLHNYKGKVKILRSSLKESDVAILGAAALVK